LEKLAPNGFYIFRIHCQLSGLLSYLIPFVSPPALSLETQRVLIKAGLGV